jgi:hypothetical protein
MLLKDKTSAIWLLCNRPCLTKYLADFFSLDWAIPGFASKENAGVGGGTGGWWGQRERWEARGGGEGGRARETLIFDKDRKRIYVQ